MIWSDVVRGVAPGYHQVPGTATTPKVTRSPMAWHFYRQRARREAAPADPDGWSPARDAMWTTTRRPERPARAGFTAPRPENHGVAVKQVLRMWLTVFGGAAGVPGRRRGCSRWPGRRGRPDARDRDRRGPAPLDRRRAARATIARAARRTRARRACRGTVPGHDQRERARPAAGRRRAAARAARRVRARPDQAPLGARRSRRARGSRPRDRRARDRGARRCRTRRPRRKLRAVALVAPPRGQVAVAFWRFADSAAVAPLIEHLRERDPAVRWRIMYALEKVVSPRIVLPAVTTMPGGS